MTSPAGVIDFFIHPPLGFLVPINDEDGPYSDTGTKTSLAGYSLDTTFGVLAFAYTIPAGYGYDIGWDSDTGTFSGKNYEDALFQLVVQHQLLSGAWVTTQEVASHKDSILVLWDTARPGRLGYYCLPGVEIQFAVLKV